MTKKLIISCIAAAAFVNTAFAEQTHNFQVVNDTKYKVILFKPDMPYLKGEPTSGTKTLVGKCTYRGSWLNKGNTQGNTTTYSWNDSNNLGSYGEGDDLGGTCTNRDKWVVFGIAIKNEQTGDIRFIPSVLGMTHRKFGGSLTGKWYNGFFYAKWINPKNSSTIYNYYDDGAYPDINKIYTTCNNNAVNACFGPYSQMEVADKNDYNWARMYRTENNWKVVVPANLDFYALPDQVDFAFGKSIQD